MTDVKKSNLLFLLFAYSSIISFSSPKKNISITHTHVYIASSSHERAFIQLYDIHHDIKVVTGKQA